MSPEIAAGPVRFRLASVIREVNARHAAEAGGGENADLDRAWVKLDRALNMATISGDEAAIRAAVDRYRREALAAIADQADRLARKNGGHR